jgi:hypothetical protein
MNLGIMVGYAILVFIVFAALFNVAVAIINLTVGNRDIMAGINGGLAVVCIVCATNVYRNIQIRKWLLSMQRQPTPL